MNNSQEILKKHAEEERRQAMAKRMAEEEQKRNDINVEHWNGMQSHKCYRMSIGGKRWSERGVFGRIIFVLGVIIIIAIITVLIYSIVRSIQIGPPRRIAPGSIFIYLR